MTNEADIAARAIGLLKAFFRANRHLQPTVLDEAFGSCAKDPRGLLQPDAESDTFAVNCVTRLLEFRCTDGHRHSLSRLLTVIREHYRGASPEPDYVELPRLLDLECSEPTRDEERDYLLALVEREEARAQIYAPLSALAQSQRERHIARLLAPWEGNKDIALLLHRPRSGATDSAARGDAPPREYDDILAAFADVRQAALLGAPGAGKSTTLRKLAVDMARRALNDPGAAVPLLVSLGFWTGEDDLDTFLAQQLPQIGLGAAPLAEQGRLILLLDGLNEVPAARRAKKAKQIKAYRRCLPEDTPFIVSCREDDYVGELKLDLDSLSLEPLTPQRVRTVLHHWLPDEADQMAPGSADRLFWQLAGDERLAGVLQTWLDAGASEDEFWTVADPGEQKQAYGRTSGADDTLWREHVPNPRSLLRLAANPFLLTMFYVTWLQNAGVLPRNRAELVSGFIDSLLSRERLIHWDPDTGEIQREERAEALMSGLGEVAAEMQRLRGVSSPASEAQPDDTGVLTVLPRAQVVEALDTKQTGIGALQLKIAEDASLLEGGAEIRFRHQLLQEYFVARSLKKQLPAGAIDAASYWPGQHWWQRSGWEEAAVLFAGLHADDCAPVIRWLKDAQPEVAVQCILESGADIPDREGLLRELHDAWLPRLTDIDREPMPEARAAIGRALGRLGLDDRKGVGLGSDGLPDIDWVEIPGGQFLYQDGERRICEPFRIARYPITYAQFQAFLDADDGYRDQRWWLGFDDPIREPTASGWPIANHPRETVSWFEAMAFCAWLGHRLDTGAQGLTIRLPAEWEWERAARGTDGRSYPWGSEYHSGCANINETWDDVGPHALGQTSPVGIYPQGASPDGVLDLAGNIWEWCLNAYGNPDQVGRGGSESRVVRGGSWASSLGDARADLRDGYHPLYRYHLIGFRVLCGAPIR